MSTLTTPSAILQLEETLLILEESLQQPTLDNTIQKKHISRLKQLYSPLFDFEHSESGSYYYAALQCIKASYIDDEAKYTLSLSPLFVKSVLCLLEINTLSLDTKRNKNAITEAFLTLAELWDLHKSHDMADLLTHVISHMRAQVTCLLNTETNLQNDKSL